MAGIAVPTSDEQLNERLIDILRELLDPKIDVNSDVQGWIEKFSEIYCGTGFRHSYALISKFLYDRSNEYDDSSDVSDILIGNIDLILGNVPKDNDALIRCICKLKDHIQLEDLRISQSKGMLLRIQNVASLQEEYRQNLSMSRELSAKIVDDAQKISEQQSSIEAQQNNIKDQKKSIEAHQNSIEDQQKNIEAQRIKIETLGDEVRNHNTQTVTVLGIFAGIVFVFSGGFTMLGGALSYINKVNGISVYMYLSTVLTVGLALYDVIYMMLHFSSYLCIKEKSSIDELTKLINSVAIVLIFGLLAVYIYQSNQGYNMPVAPAQQSIVSPQPTFGDT